MDFTKLDGLIQALESELSNPAPHHLNLTKLVIRSLQAIKEELQTAQMPLPLSNTIDSNSKTITENASISESKPKRKRVVKSR